MDAIKANLLFGGDSDERLVSVASAQNLAQTYPWTSLFFFTPTMDVQEVNRTELVAHNDPFKVAFAPQTKKVSFLQWCSAQSRDNEVSFLGFHGGEQENGVFQRNLEKFNLHYTGSRSEASKICFNKNQSKELLKIALRTGGLSPSEVIEITDSPLVRDRLHSRLEKSPLVLKPNRSGSSFGLFFIHNKAELEQALRQMARGSLREYIIEDFIPGREVTVGVVEDERRVLQALPATEVILDDGRHFDYDGKYLGTGTKEITPARITPAEMKACQDMALVAHQTLGCRGYSRTDLILGVQGPIFLEINTLPGLTRASFLPQQLDAASLPMKKFIEQQIYLALY